MLKIYSIKEIISATKSILGESHLDKNKLSTNDSITAKKKILEESLPKEIESIILEAENSQKQNKINKSTKKFNQENKHPLEEFRVSKEELVESLHKTFSKKIKKNTLKLILDLREEIIFLTKNISWLKEKKKEEEFNNKTLKKNIIDSTYVQNELNSNLKKTQTDFNLLKEQNRNLNVEHTLLKEQTKNLNIEHISLKNNFLKLRKILIHLKNQTISLKNNNIKINSQLNIYKNKESVSKLKIKKLEEEILINRKLLNENNENNKEINSQLNQIDEYKQEIKELREKNKDQEKTINNLKLNIDNNQEKTIDDLSLSINNNEDVNVNDLENKIKHYQEENIRISNELVESNKKSEITKESLNELESHRSGLIEKINSINEVIQNENIVTNVFRSDLNENKIKVINRSKPKKKNMIDLNEKIKNIFSND